jgi:hypothetical protein
MVPPQCTIFTQLIPSPPMVDGPTTAPLIQVTQQNDKYNLSIYQKVVF